MVLPGQIQNSLKVLENIRENDKDIHVELGLDNGWVQEFDSQAVFFPDFIKPNPFKQEFFGQRTMC